MKYGLIAICLGLSACSLVPPRDPRSGYGEFDSGYSASDFYDEKRRHEEEQSREELGWSNSRPLSEDERDRLENRLRLRRLESRLESKAEKKQYYALKGLMRGDAERIAFLSIPTVSARERWAQNRGLIVDDEKHSDSTTDAIEKNDVVLGMTSKAVTESWGDPDLVEVAGDPVYGNERWRYSRYVSSEEGYQKQDRVIYFEAGRVVGWESDSR